MREIIKHYIRFFKQKTWYSYKGQKAHEKNVYNMKDFGKEMTFVHRTLKLGFIKPGILFCKWFFKGKLKTQIDNDYQFRKLNVFNQAYEDALTKWNGIYRPYAYGEFKLPRVFADDYATQTLRLIKEMYVTINHSDTAYLEFHNFLMDEIFKGMSKMDKSHIMYTSKSITDFKYFKVADELVNGQIVLVEEKL